MMEVATMNRIFVSIWRHQWILVLAAQSNNQSLHYPPSTQMPIKCCDNQFIKAEKSRSAKFKRKRLIKGGAFTNVSFAFTPLCTPRVLVIFSADLLMARAWMPGTICLRQIGRDQHTTQIGRDQTDQTQHKQGETQRTTPARRKFVGNNSHCFYISVDSQSYIQELCSSICFLWYDTDCPNLKLKLGWVLWATHHLNMCLNQSCLCTKAPSRVVAPLVCVDPCDACTHMYISWSPNSTAICTCTHMYMYPHGKERS